MTKSQKDRLEEAARLLERSQADIVREALDLHLPSILESTGMIEACELAVRQRKERMDLEGPKDRHRTGLKPRQAWETIIKEWDVYKDMLTVDDFDAWIERLVENKKSIDPKNPEYKRVMRKYDMYIARLHEERKKYVEE